MTKTKPLTKILKEKGKDLENRILYWQQECERLKNISKLVDAVSIKTFKQFKNGVKKGNWWQGDDLFYEFYYEGFFGNQFKQERLSICFHEKKDIFDKQLFDSDAILKSIYENMYTRYLDLVAWKK